MSTTSIGTPPNSKLENLDLQKPIRKNGTPTSWYHPRGTIQGESCAALDAPIRAPDASQAIPKADKEKFPSHALSIAENGAM